MKIAFDVKGTIDGRRQSDVLKMFHALHAMGHEMYVWSNCLSYALEAVKKHNLPAEAIDKYSHSDAKEWDKPIMDLAIEDDTSQTWLAAAHMVFVYQIPQDLGSSFARGLVKNLTLYKNSTDK